jgi:hypothetical protein
VAGPDQVIVTNGGIGHTSSSGAAGAGDEVCRPGDRDENTVSGRGQGCATAPGALPYDPIEAAVTANPGHIHQHPQNQSAWLPAATSLKRSR